MQGVNDLQQNIEHRIDARPWAAMRKFLYGSGVIAFLLLVALLIYFMYFHKAPTCFDGAQNGPETGIDCGGACARVCAVDIQPPIVRFARAFPGAQGTYNAIAYVENKNNGVGAENIPYHFTLYDDRGEVITTVEGHTKLPPGNVYAVFADRIDVGTAVPEKTTFDFDLNTPWTKMEKGKEIFDVQSKELTNADAKPKLNAKIINKSLDDVQNVEAIATIFDAAGSPLTASRTVIPLMKRQETKGVTFTWPTPIAKTVRSCVVPSDVILAVDLSGSMDNDGGEPPEPIASVLRAASGFANRLKPADQSGLVTFATDAAIVSPLGSDNSATADIVSKLFVAPKEEHGSTNIGDALRAGIIEFSSERHNQNARKVMVLLTDGKANAPEKKDITPEDYALAMAHEAAIRGIEIYTIGLGSDVNSAFLSTLATNNKYAYQAADKASLDQIYQTISQSLCEDGPAVIDIITKTNETNE
jgi:Mg-chelatase subunit ChlD/cbb3-type cytochrome oxidase subunit 3